MKKTVSLIIGALILSMAVPGQTMAAGSSKSAKTSKDAETSAKDTAVKHIPMLETNSYYSVRKEDAYYRIVEVQYPGFSLDEKSAKKYAKLEKALEKFSQGYSETAENALDELTELCDENGAPDSDAERLRDNMESIVVRSDSVAVSTLTCRLQYYGGVHPSQTYIGATFDAETGKQLSLKDVITDIDGYEEIVRNKLEDQYPNLYAQLVTIEEFDEAVPPEENQSKWYLTDEGMEVCFSEYDIASYADGALFLFIGFDEAPEIFNSKYTRAPENYILPMKDSIKVWADADGDGSRDEIWVEDVPQEDSSDMYTAVYHCGDKSLDGPEENYYYSRESYLVKSGGEYYLYLIGSAEDDWETLNVIDLGKMKSVQLESGNLYPTTIDYSSDDGDDYASGSHTEIVLTDPSAFELESRLNLLGTYMCRKTYHVGKDGAPKTDDTMYTVRTRNAVKTLQSVKGVLVNRKGKEKKEITIGKGVYLAAVRTDGKTYVDFQEVDAGNVDDPGYPVYLLEEAPQINYSENIIRIYVDDGPFSSIGGVKESEVLEGMPYSG